MIVAKKKGIKKVALVQMPPWNPEFPPLALAMIASMLKRKHVKIKCFDFNKILTEEEWRLFYKGNTSFFEANLFNLLLPENHFFIHKKWKELALKTDSFLNQCFNELLSFKPDIVAFSVCTYAIQTLSLLLAKRIKKINPKIEVIFGGAIYAKNLNNKLPLKLGFVDEIIPKGEEYRFFEKFEDKSNVDFDPDITYFDSFDLKKYKHALPMIWSEGCNMNCKFCIHPVIGGHHKIFSIEKIIKQIKFYAEHYNIRSFRLNDSSFNQNPEALYEICDRIIKEKLDISWEGNFYVHPGIKTGLLKKMAQAGCKRVFIGLESGSQKILDELNKGFTVDVAKDVIKRVRNCGIKAWVYIIIGSPSESHEDYLQTLKVLQELREYLDPFYRITLFYYQKGSQFYLNAKKNNTIKIGLPQNLKDYEEDFPYTYYPKPNFENSTINDVQYLSKITFNIFNPRLKKSSLAINPTYYGCDKSVILNGKKIKKEGKNSYLIKIPEDVDKLDNLIRTSKEKMSILLDINYAFYFDKKRNLMDYLYKLKSSVTFKLCRPIPKCFTKAIVSKENLTYECKDCISYLYLNRNKKIVYCKDKFWDYYIQKDNNMRDICMPCLYRKENFCRMYCIQYTANAPLVRCSE